MQDTPSSCHPLRIACVKDAAAPRAVMVLDRALNDVCHSLDATVRMKGKGSAGHPIFSQNQEWIGEGKVLCFQLGGALDVRRRVLE